MKKVHLIIVLGCFVYACFIHLPAFSNDYAQLNLIGFSKEGEYLAYQVRNTNNEPAFTQEKVVILDVNNKKILKTIIQDQISAPQAPPPQVSAPLEVEPERESLPEATQEDFSAFYHIDLEKYRIIEWNKGIVVYQTSMDPATVNPLPAKEVNFVIKDEKNQAYAYKVLLQSREADNSAGKADESTYKPRLFTCKILSPPWEGTLSSPAPATADEQGKELTEGQTCCSDYFIQSLYIYRNKIVAFIYAGTPVTDTTDSTAVSWSLITVLGTLNRTFAVIPEAPVLTDVIPASQYARPLRPQALPKALIEPAAATDNKLSDHEAPEQDFDSTVQTETATVSSQQEEGAEAKATPVILATSTLLPAPHLDVISPNPDYDGDVYLSWEEVPGASVYKVYRELLPITETAHLKPLAVTSDWYYVDKSLKEKKIYWYAVAAVKRLTGSHILAADTSTGGGANTVDNTALTSESTQESPPSRSKSVFVDFEPASLIFWEDFDAHNVHEIPVGWITNNNTASAMWFFTHSSWAIPSQQLMISDNKEEANVWGYTNFKSAVREGWFECDIKLIKQLQEAGSAEQDYFLNLNTEKGGEKIITLRIHYNLARHQYTFILQGVSCKNWFNENQSYRLRLAFGGKQLSLQVDGKTEIADVPYTAKSIRQLSLETSNNMYGGGCLFDNLALWDISQKKEQKQDRAPLTVHTSSPRARSRQELFTEYRLQDENMKAENFNQIGFQLYRENNHQAALQLFLCALEQDYTYARGYYNTACMLSLLEARNLNPQPEQALAYLEQAYRFDPDFVLRAEKDQDLALLKKKPEYQKLNELYYYSFESADLNIFAAGFARCVQTHRWQDLLNYLEKSYLAEYFERLYDKKIDLFFCDFFELSNLLAFKAKKELSTFLLNQIKDCKPVKLDDEAVTFQILLDTETNAEREIIISLRKSTTAGKAKYGFVRYFSPRG